MKRTLKNIIISTFMAGVVAVTPLVESAAHINIISASVSAAAYCRRFTLTQTEYNQIISHWNNKGVSYLGRDLYPSANKKLAVKDMQMLLNKVLGCNLVVDGLFGEGTRAQVLAFQRATGLWADGLFGSGSFNKIMQYADIVSEAASISFDSMTVPTSLTKGNSFNLGGTVSCNKPLSYITGEILNVSGNAIISKTAYTSAYSHNIRNSAINTVLKFGSLSDGEYILRYTAVASDGTYKKVSYNFSVKSTQTSPIIISSFQKYNASAVMSQATSDVGRLNGRQKYNTEWCAAYVGDLITTYGGVSSSIKNYNVTGLTTNIVNNDLGTLYLFSDTHYNAAKNSAAYNSSYAYTSTGAKFTQTGISNTQYVSKNSFTPQAGDIILFNWNTYTRGTFAHVGLVKYMNGNYVYTIEGNTGRNNQVNANYVSEGNRWYYDSQVVGIIRMK